MARSGKKFGLIGKGRMTEGEKLSLVNFYLSFYAPRSVRRGATRDMIDEQYPYDLDDVKRLIDRGLVEITIPVSERRGGSKLIGMSPQGIAVARMILGLTRRRKTTRRRSSRNPARERMWRSYEIGVYSPVYDAVIERMGYIGAPDDVPASQLKRDALEKIGYPRSDLARIRLRETHRSGARWV